MNSVDLETKEKLRHFLADQLQLTSPEKLADEDDLFDLGITSHAFIRMVGYLTTELGADLDAGLKDLDSARTLSSVHQLFFPTPVV